MPIGCRTPRRAKRNKRLVHAGDRTRARHTQPQPRKNAHKAAEKEHRATVQVYHVRTELYQVDATTSMDAVLTNCSSIYCAERRVVTVALGLSICSKSQPRTIYLRLKSSNGVANTSPQASRSKHHICSATRYTGRSRQRILTGGGKDWKHGHEEGGNTGVAYYNKQKTSGWQNVRPNTNWVVMCAMASR